MKQMFAQVVSSPKAIYRLSPKNKRHKNPNSLKRKAGGSTPKKNQSISCTHFFEHKMKLLLCLALAFLLPTMLPAQKKLKTAEEYYTRGISKSESKPESALSDLDAVLKLDSLYCGAYSAIASIKQQKKDYKAALRFYTKAIECTRSLRDNQGSTMFTSAILGLS